jgi:hypothetical protein
LALLCVLILCANLATAHGSFLVDGWKVWNNATIAPDSRIETAAVPVRVTLPSHQTVWIGDHSIIRLQPARISIEKGCAELDSEGEYSFAAAAQSGLRAGANPEELARATQILQEYQSLQELRPMSQRP